jgi:hypothetical protein
MAPRQLALNEALGSHQLVGPKDMPRHKVIAETSAANGTQIQVRIDDELLSCVPRHQPLPRNAITIGAGANTINIGRARTPNRIP